MDHTKVETLVIDLGTKRLSINGDPSKIIEFNPSDARFAEKFYLLLGELEAKLEEQRVEFAKLEEDKALDAHGFPVNAPERLAFMRKSCEYMNGRFDYLFGEGTSEKAFDGVLNLELYAQFLNEVAPFIQDTRQSKMADYVMPKTNLTPTLEKAQLKEMRKRRKSKKNG